MTLEKKRRIERGEREREKERQRGRKSKIEKENERVREIKRERERRDIESFTTVSPFPCSSDSCLKWRSRVL